MINNKRLCLKLKGIMAEKEITQKYLADCLNVTQGTLSVALNGEADYINLRVLDSICQVLEVEVWGVIKEAEE